MSEHLKSNDTFGKSREILERLTGKTIDELESVENVMLSHTPAEIGHFVDEINHIEIKGVENYAQQFQSFVNGFRGSEAPYIFAGLKTFLDVSLTAAPFNDPDIKNKYEAVLQTVEKNTLRVCISEPIKREGSE